jgi:ribonuclease BN (tRNA processing enzyme)
MFRDLYRRQEGSLEDCVGGSPFLRHFFVYLRDSTKFYLCLVPRFSGDTKPCQALIDAGQHADLLIHEASLGPEETELAETKGHSTIDQAIQIALQY